MENQAIENNSVIFRLEPNSRADIILVLRELESEVLQKLSNRIVHLNGIKWYISLRARYVKIDVERNLLYTDATFTSDVQRTMQGDDLNPQLAQVYQDIFIKSQEFEAQGSGWSLDEIQYLDVHSTIYVPLQGNSFIETPARLKFNKSIVNIENKDNKCIVWSLLAHFYPVRQNRRRVKNYKHNENKLNLRNVRFPTPLTDISKIERQNDLSIHVFEWNGKVYPLRLSKEIKTKHINLLFLKNSSGHHYCLIQDFGRLMRTQIKGNKRYFCYNCLHGFYKDATLQSHKLLCENQKAQKTIFPRKDQKILTFQNFANQLRVPFVVYADFECYTNQDCSSKENAYQKHIPSGFCFYTVCFKREIYRYPVLYRGENVIDVFFEKLLLEEEWITSQLSNEAELNMTFEDCERYRNTDTCHICDETIVNNDKVRDHCHLTGKFRGPAHNECNLKYKWKKHQRTQNAFVIPVIFHNLKGYDAHLLMSSFGKFKKRRIQCIPNNNERYLSVSSGGLRFIDSFQFMSSSLEKLVSNMYNESKDQFKLMAKEFEMDCEFLLRKGVYPYDYVDSPEKLHETALPPKEAFYSQLNEENITDEDYNYASFVWNHFSCRTLGDYHDLYLKVDVIQLADVFESFRDAALLTYRLDPAHYFSAPGLSWDSMLRYK